jgi:2-iminobutanoate/2-iminopropanoate deaminase
MQKIQTDTAPTAIGPYSQAIVFENLIFTSGQIALTPSGKMKNESIETETRQVLENLKNVLAAADSDFSRVIKTTIFLRDINDFEKVNIIYAEFFGESKPARETVAVKDLPKNARIEISAISLATKTNNVPH